MANLSQRTGTTPVNTRIGLANNAASNVQNFNGYDSQELIGHVFIDGTTDYRAAVRIVVVKNGAGVYEVAATDIAGDDISGSPIVSFSMSGSILQATLPNITGFSSAYIDYHLVSPKLNATYPLSVDAGQVVSGTIGSARLPIADETAPGAMEIVEYITTDPTGLITGADNPDNFKLTLRKVNDKMVYGFLGGIFQKQGTGNNISFEFPAEFRPSSYKYGSQIWIAIGTTFETGILIVQGDGCNIYRTTISSIPDNTLVSIGLNQSSGGGVSFFYFLD